jgi:peroxiredoxin Q/BCP
VKRITTPMTRIMSKFIPRLAPKIIMLLCFLFLSVAMKVGDPVPDFSVLDQNKKAVRLSDFKGKLVLIFFYPKDESPGCTTEALGFKEEYSKIEKLGAVVLGVSSQGFKEHQAFIKKHELPFPLLVDIDGSLAESFGIGKHLFVGPTKRKSVLIGPDGKLVRFYEEVEPSTHAKEVLEDIEKIKR